MAKVPQPGTSTQFPRPKRRYKPRGAAAPKINDKVFHIAGNAWEPQYKESGPAYEAFKYFMDLGPARELKAVSEDIGKSYTLITRWAAEWRWWDRARAWDGHLVKQEQEAFAQEAKKMARRQARLGMAMQQVAEAKIERIAASPEQLEALEPSDAIRLAVEGSKIERTARGEEKANQNITFIFNGPPPQWAPKAVTEVAATAPTLEGEVQGESPVFPQLPAFAGVSDGN